MKNFAEFLGTYLLVSAVIGSGIMAENLSNGNIGVALLANTIATGSILFVIIKMFGPISGAHFNPVVSLVFFLRKELPAYTLLNYIMFQIIGGYLAVLSTHYIFNISIIQISTNIRGEWPLVVSEVIATMGLILTILFFIKHDKNSVALGVALFICAGYWFTSSTSFANPAVTFARIFTDTFTGISIKSTPYFILGQIIGSILGYRIFKFFE